MAVTIALSASLNNIGTASSLDETESFVIVKSGVGKKASMALVEAAIGGAGVSDGDKGDITVSGSGATWTVDANAITLAKVEDIATASFLGRNTASTGDPEVLPVATAKTMLGLSGTNSGDQTISLTGDVTGSGTGSFATEIAADSVGFPEMANLTTDRLIGRDTAGTGDPEALTVGGGIEFTGSGGIQRSALTGAVTASAGSGTTAIAAGAVGPTELAATAVTPGSYTGADITVDADGRLTAAASGTYPFSMSELFGMQLSNNVADATNDIDITAGKRRDSTDAQNIVGAASTKRLDAAWAVGSGNGGLDTGAIANTTYHVFTIKRSDTGVVDYLFSTSASAPTMPTSYDYKRRIGSIIRVAAAIKGFLQTGDHFQWMSPPMDVDVATPGTSSISYILTVPSGFKLLADLEVFLFNNTTTTVVYVRDPNVTDSVPATNAAPGGTVTAGSGDPAGVLVWARCRTNTSSQVAVRSNVSANTFYRLWTLGWHDTRGRDD